ncbi:hypothetical protein E5K00_07455 [Hymenobacter aquaticus]|uniref:Uncharacterized protein n=1 Tax=Hymenobacter aquaticus TaxID=1867101 RepID=A0A4Z0Q6F4_9BACT|nr:hypothetical protein [Hymenobacter aquaticus]TGE25026.1 hypothetical protein E5K00_07455 [Hymenobacter aquaticus]
MKTTTTSLLWAALLGVSLSACQKEEQSLPTPTAQTGDARGLDPVAQAANVRITGQLDSTIAYANTNPALNLKLVSYAFRSRLTTAEEVAAAKARILDAGSIIPVYGDLQKGSKANQTPPFELMSLRENAQRQPGGSVNEAQAGINAYLSKSLQAGLGQVELTWERDGQRFTSLCLYNEKGLVYDNMLANLFTLKDQRTSDVASEQAKVTTTPFTATAVDFDIEWIWGSQRGHITVKHTILYGGGKITTNSGTATAWMSAGSAQARQQRYVLRTTYAQLTWAYGWATPTASFSFSYSGSPVKINASVSGVGSKGQGEGIHTIYL